MSEPCPHDATVTAPTWPVVHSSKVAVGDPIVVLPPHMVTECVTCRDRVDLDAPAFTVTLIETEEPK